MARYIVTADSYFRPFTYDEIVKPLQQMTDAHNAAADAYDALNLETEALGRYISSEEGSGDERARHMYDNYLGNLRALQDELWSNGYSARARRDLTAARNGYANDILRIKKAVENRQARGKEYWDYYHKNPDTIMGNDPTTAGLDAYLDDDNYGTNWFSYNGVDFMKNVAADAQARALEYVNRSGENYRNVPGYITRVVNNGFTNDEVDAAVSAVRDGSYVNLGDGPVKVLADVLASHLQSTGAVRGQNVSEEQYDRFFDYGRTGLAAGILKPETKDYSDKIWDANMQVSTAQRIYAAQHPTPTETPSTPISNGLNLGSTVDLESPGYRELVKATKDSSKYYHDEQGNHKSVPLIMDGHKIDVDNDYDMANYLYGTENREKMRTSLGGIDVALGNSEKQEGVLSDGKKIYTGKISKEDAERLGLDRKDAIGIYWDSPQGKKLNDKATLYATAAYKEVQDRVSSIESENSHLNQISKMAISPKKQAELRKKLDYPSTEPWNNFYNYATAVETQGRYSAPMLAGADPSHEYAAKALRSALEESWISAPKVDKEKKNVAKGSKYAAYEVSDGGVSLANEDGETDMAKVLGTHSDGTIAWENAKNFGNIFQNYGRKPTIRFQSAYTNRTYEMDASAFSPLVENALSNKSGILGQIMMPVSDPKRVIQMSNEESRAYGEMIYKTLSDIYPGVRLPVRQYRDSEGNVRLRPATAKEIMLNAADRELLQSVITNIVIDPMLSDIRKYIGVYHE